MTIRELLIHFFEYIEANHTRNDYDEFLDVVHVLEPESISDRIEIVDKFIKSRGLEKDRILISGGPW